MDLLGSIMSSMQRPPSVGDKEKKAAKERSEKLMKQQEERKKKIAELRKKMEGKVGEFCKDDKATKLECEPMSKVERALVHEMAEHAGLVSFSFGEEGVDRHLVIWKKEQVPSDAELAAMRAGVEYKAPDPNAQKDTASSARKVITPTAPNSDYMAKYKKIIGEETSETVALSAADTYGFVPSSLKRDHRSIEETMNEIRARKKACLPNEKTAATSASSTSSEETATKSAESS